MLALSPLKASSNNGTRIHLASFRVTLPSYMRICTYKRVSIRSPPPFSSDVRVFFSPIVKAGVDQPELAVAILSLLGLIRHNGTKDFRREIGSFLPLFEDFGDGRMIRITYSFFHPSFLSSSVWNELIL